MSDQAVQAQAWSRALNDLFGHATPTAEPVLLSVGAQPGAGKTRGLEAALATFYPGKDFVRIIGDDLRRYHPDYERFCASKDPELMPARTAELSGWLVGRSLAYASAHGYSTVVEGTLRRAQTTLGTINQFAQAGARTHLVVLGVSPAESWSGCLERYLSALDDGQSARWTPLEAHNAGLEGTPVTLRAAHNDPGVHRISVIDRAGVVHYDNTRTPQGAWEQPGQAEDVLERLRSQPAHPKALEARIEALEARAARLGAPELVMEGIAHARSLVHPKLTKAQVLASLNEAVRQRSTREQNGVVATQKRHTR